MFGWAARGIAEVIGLLGIVGSLAFVGLEVRQNSVAEPISCLVEWASSVDQRNA
ncbi:MAG: hypothetical protein ACI9ON_002311 [Limisphaerales bacterium]|jgi:hypothetical protein